MEVNQLSDRRHKYHVPSMLEANGGIKDIVGGRMGGDLFSIHPANFTAELYGVLRTQAPHAKLAVAIFLGKTTSYTT